MGLITIVEEADMIILVHGDKRSALGPDIQAKLVEGLRKVLDETPPEPPGIAA